MDLSPSPASGGGGLAGFAIAMHHRKGTYMKRVLLFALGVLAVPTTALAANYAVLQRYPLGGAGKWDYVTLDAGAQRLYIARGNRVMVMDTQTGKLAGEVPGANGAHRVVILPEQHRGYVSNGHADSVMPFDLATLKPLPAIAIRGKGPDAMLFDKMSASLWTFNGHSNNASVVDPISGKETATVALPGKPEFAVTDDSGHIYVNLEDSSQVAEIDVKETKVVHIWSLAPCEGPTGLAIDLKHRRLFSACANQKLIVLDADNGRQVASLPIGHDPDAAAYDSSLGMVFSSNADGSLTVIQQNDADHYAVVTNVATAKGARTMTVDNQQHKVYLAAPDVTTSAQGTFGVLVVGAH
jgi:DNA-binding beta-propeller fold protein YncE